MAAETVSDERASGERVAVAKDPDEKGAATKHRAAKVRAPAGLEATVRARASTATLVVAPVPALMVRLAKTSTAYAGRRLARVRLAALFREIELAAALDPNAELEASVAPVPAAANVLWDRPWRQ